MGHAATFATFAPLGTRASTDFSLGTMEAAARAGIGWRHAIGDLDPTSAHAFDASNAFSIVGTPAARDTTLIELGVDLQISPNASLSFSYGGQFSAVSTDQSFKAGFGVNF